MYEDKLVVAMTTKGLGRYIHRLKVIAKKGDPGHSKWLTEQISATKTALDARRKMDASGYSLDENFWGKASDRDDLIEGGE